MPLFILACLFMQSVLCQDVDDGTPTVAEFIDYEIVELESFLLTDEQAKLCGTTGYFADPDDCCHYIQCDGDEWEGWRQFCMGGTVWDPTLCACVHHEDYPACDPKTCNTGGNASFPECPENLAENQCCLKYDRGQVYTRNISDPTMYKVNDGPWQTCPFGGKFLLDSEETDSCYCEYDTRNAPCPCLRFSFDNPFDDFHPLYDDQGIYSEIGEVIWMFPGAPPSPGIGAMFMGSNSWFSVPRYANVDFQSNLTVTFFIRPDSGFFNGPFFHNGGPGGEDATISLEYYIVNGQAWLVAGVQAEDGTDDIILKGIRFPVKEYTFIALVYDMGEVSLYVGDNPPIAVMESASIDNEDKKLLLRQVITDTFTKAVSLKRNQTDNIRKTTIKEVEDVSDELGFYVDNTLSTYLTGSTLFREALNEYIKSPSKREELSIELKTMASEVQEALAELEKLVVELKNVKKKLAEIDPEEEDISISDLKWKFGRMKTRIFDLVGGFGEADVESGLGRSIQMAFELLENDGFISKRKKRAPTSGAEGPNICIKPSKFPITFGENFNGFMDEMTVCNFAATMEQIELHKSGIGEGRFESLAYP
ncbi:unnamed protein product [Owenia fusiformis]|uniref:Chitin-binding type-2 domain-containing protein n=1 Tax=Owenia fusiformis TaxID=6347 RepID=A0A8S4PNW4_OWEFU|nr:unnamed protein product [Owenia fusiformis]